ncbi:MAG TPA: sensor histidine kinase, partial [Sphingomicrobium sp.]|nr:sensor histidine kinase [Sphingomicrobium sp.]
ELRSTLLPLKPVALETDIDAVSLPSARAVSVGLILNELVTNAIKYAYPDDKEGTICVYLECTDEQIELSVEDDGIGMPEGEEQGSGLGHRLVRSLAAQLGGRFACEASSPGSSCMVTFPRQPTSRRKQQRSGVNAHLG